jgi:hypothetical protein
MLSDDTPANVCQRQWVRECLSFPKDGLDQVRKFYDDTVPKLLGQHSRKLGRNQWKQVDIVRE